MVTVATDLSELRAKGVQATVSTPRSLLKIGQRCAAAPWPLFLEMKN
jgi:hypothetical protein